MQRPFRILFRLRNVLAGLPVIPALLCTHWEWEDDFAVWALGLSACGLGIGLRAWATSHCSYGQGERRGALTTTGPYAFTRNPLYLGSGLILAGLTITSELLWLLPVTLTWTFLVFSGVVRWEEARLLRKYGEEYREYCSRTPRWIPAFRGLPTPPLRRALLRQSAALLLLLPFLMKELDILGLWS